MTPKAKQRKLYIASINTESIQKAIQNLTMQDQLEVAELSLQQLGFLDQIRFSRKPTKTGRKLTLMETSKAV